MGFGPGTHAIGRDTNGQVRTMSEARRSLSGSLRRAALAGCALVLLAAAPATADGPLPGPGPELVLLHPHPLVVASGGRTTAYAHVLNRGTAPTTEPFTLVLQLPPGVFVAQPFSPADCRPEPFGHTVSCAFPAGLRPGETDTAVIPVFTSSGLPCGVLSGNAEVDTTGTPVLDSPAPFDIVVT